MWQNLWSIKAPPKEVNLLWRATANYRHTKQRLVQKHILSDDLCLCYDQDSETVLHILVDCDLAKEVWNQSGVGLIIGNSSTFLDWLELVFS